MGTSDFLKTIFDFLNTETEYAVLRNFEGLPHHNNSRDIEPLRKMNCKGSVHN